MTFNIQGGATAKESGHDKMMQKRIRIVDDDSAVTQSAYNIQTVGDGLRTTQVRFARREMKSMHPKRT